MTDTYTHTYNIASDLHGMSACPSRKTLHLDSGYVGSSQGLSFCTEADAPAKPKGAREVHIDLGYMKEAPRLDRLTLPSIHALQQLELRWIPWASLSRTTRRGS